MYSWGAFCVSSNLLPSNVCISKSRLINQLHRRSVCGIEDRLQTMAVIHNAHVYAGLLLVGDSLQSGDLLRIP